MYRVSFILILLLGYLPAVYAGYTIETIAGGERGYSGDGGPATAASLIRPTGIAIDNQGNMYIADRDNRRIRKIDSTGKITTIAGDGSENSTGDGRLASEAQLVSAYGLVVDSGGNIYFSEHLSHKVRKIDVTGFITTVAGNGQAGFSGDGDFSTSAQLDTPKGLAIDDAGNIYIADSGNHRIRKIETTGIIRTVAGDGSTKQVGLSIEGPIYEGTYGGDGWFAIRAQLNTPNDVAVDSLGNLYIADTNNHRIRMVNQGFISTIAGNGDTQLLNSPINITVTPNNVIYIADTYNHRVRLLENNELKTIAGDTGIQGFKGDGGDALQARLAYPSGLAVDSANNLYIADTENHRVRKLTIELNQPDDGKVEPSVESHTTSPPPQISSSQLPDLGQGQTFITAQQFENNSATFRGGISVNGSDYQQTVEQSLSDPVDIRGSIKPVAEDVGKTAHIVVYAAYKPTTDTPNNVHYMLNSSFGIPQWDQTTSNLVGFIENVTLSNEVPIQMYSGNFVAPGVLFVSFGYKLIDSNKVVVNSQTIDIVINP